jgi:hypothetical protein
MQEPQARALSEFRDTVRVGSDLAAACALRARLAERDPVPYSLSPQAEAVLSKASPQPQNRPVPGPLKRAINRFGQTVCDLIDNALYGDLLAVGRVHEAEIRRIKQASEP